MSSQLHNTWQTIKSGRQFLLERSRLLTTYGLSQIAVQIMNALSGFILVRTMAKEEYAWFTIALGSVATIYVIADAGLGSAFSAIGGPLAKDTSKFASLMHLIRRRRLIYVLTTALSLLPITFWLLYSNGAQLVTVISVVALIALTALITTEAIVFGAGHRLRTRIIPLMKTEILASGVRLGLIALACGLGFGIGVVVAIACTLFAQLARLALLTRQSADLRSLHDTESDNWVPQINHIIAHSLPLVIFYCVQGQIATFILALFATTNQVADLGALTRFQLVFGLFTLPLGHFVFPAISRCTNAVRLRKMVLFTIAGASTAYCGLALTGIVAAPLLLWILGPNYSHLTTELTWYLGNLALVATAGMLWSIIRARGWVRDGWIQIPAAILIMVAGAQWLDFSNTSSVIIFSALSSVASLCVGIWLLCRGIQDSMISGSSDLAHAE